MKFLLILAVISSVKPQLILPQASQFHAQDSLGQYSYGYTGGPSSKIESKTIDGVTRGGYSYIDANGLLQSVNYIADPFNGFRVAATNLPEQPKTPILKYPEAQFQDLKFRDSAKPLEYSTKPLEYAAYPYPFAYPSYYAAHYPAYPYYPYLGGSPNEIKALKPASFYAGPAIPAVAAPTIAPLPEQPKREYFYPNPADLAFRSSPKPEELHKPAVPEEINSRSKRDIIYPIYAPTYGASQFEIKDNLGQYTYGYNTPQSSKTESRSIDGSTNGAYSYVDPNGFVQAVQYTADANGFRTNLP